MPLTNRELAILGLLLFSVPFQLWLSKLSSLTPEEKGLRIKEFIFENQLQIQAIMSPSVWIFWLKDLLKLLFSKDYSHLYPDSSDPQGECPAVEVLKYRYPSGYFATSIMPRVYRPDNVKWRVGQVIRHKKYNYIGVITGWDRTCQAPDFWIKKVHGENHNLRMQPTYSVLVDIRMKMTAQATYVAEENIEIIKHEVKHPDLINYFDSFDGAQYLPQPWLKALYPLD